MTAHAAIEISIKINSWEDLPQTLVETLKEALQFREMDKALDAAEGTARAAELLGAVEARQGEAPLPTPLPASGERERMEEVAPETPAEPPQPHGEIIALLLADLDTSDVTRTLIVPLLDRWPEVRGDPKDVLPETADKFRFYPERKLKFALTHLLKGKHVYFPDAQEIYGALGRFEGHQARKKQEEAQRELVSNGARL